MPGPNPVTRPARRVSVRPRYRTWLCVTVVAAALSLSGGACRNRARGGTTASDSVFVATMTDLYAVSGDRSLDSAARAVARDSVLRAHAVTSDVLEATARALGEQPDRAERVWASIDSEARRARPAAAPASPVAPPR